MKKIVIAVIITAMVVGAGVFAAFAMGLRPTPLDVDDIDLSAIADGEYIGICQNKILFAVVRVEVQDHQIVAVEILEHKASYMEQAVQIGYAVMDAQSLDVDAIAGATLTSDTVKKAIEDALTPE